MSSSVPQFGKNETIREKIEKSISDMQELVRLVEAKIEIEEELAGIDPTLSIAIGQLKARRDNLVSTISQLKDALARPPHLRRMSPRVQAKPFNPANPRMLSRLDRLHR